MRKQKLFKKVVIAYFASTILFSSIPAYAAETQCTTEENVQNSTQKSEIIFRDIPWYSAKKDAEGVLTATGATGKEDGWQSDSLYRLSALNYPNVNSTSDRVDGGGCKMQYSGLSVAGYTPSDINACYIYQLDNSGSIVRDADNALLYLAWYTFDKDDFTDYESLFNDLATKLSSLYGTATDDEDKYLIKKTWTDSSNNSARLIMDTKKTYVILGYLAAEADNKLDAMQTAIDAENSAAEAAEREKNASNTDGL